MLVLGLHAEEGGWKSANTVGLWKVGTEPWEVEEEAIECVLVWLPNTTHVLVSTGLQ